jgi:D-arabinose 1-dehydrogenase-like Zn-dependent alcohol dehydrogenase
MPAPKTLPMVPGCDGAGVVAALGPGATRWQVGDEVVINPSFACGHCPECLADRSVFCPEFGIMGEHRWGTHGRRSSWARPTWWPVPPVARGRRREPTACAA